MTNKMFFPYILIDGIDVNMRVRVRVRDMNMSMK